MLVYGAKHFNVHEIVPGISAAIANQGTGAVANAGFVDLGESILVFDSFNTQQAATELRDLISSITGKPVSHVINSHWHGDHVRGNQVFRGIPIVATEQTKNVMGEIHPARISRQQAELGKLHDYIADLEVQLTTEPVETDRQQLVAQISFLKEVEISLPTLELVLPTTTFETAWYTEGENRRAECHTLGGGHTASDAFLYIPDARVCFIGDLVAVNNHMLVVDGNIYHWLSILEELTSWDIEYVVPGHGPIGGKACIELAAEYLRDLLEMARTMGAKGPEVELDTLSVPEKYANWAARELFATNIKHLLDTV